LERSVSCKLRDRVMPLSRSDALSRRRFQHDRRGRCIKAT